ncbi:Armadillo/betacatenin-like repeat domain containing protein [Acanthamoeba castellanii str. Neff]|uniref:Armadillo/betacatenin-like repeat domain containing protein n=1 Tax=Acanthamoeba castellanii (strain ATCC 30010 / Neff) TaxID=1257118 RepID=L8GMC7_ACACF|nr:Armadillo/betacatenin-like repeat domain containing protein [Acanthamoeba castellanii str. Neff]ELR14215.1 Armadillo/betacatenin-like repeat domain containing protein [Acanthamoeba castellanii str. Neff]
MPAFATASYCFYEEDSEKPTPLALKIRSFSIPQLAQLLAADAIQPEFRKQALIEIGKRALATMGAFKFTWEHPDVSNSFELFEKGAIDATIQCLKSQDDEVLELASRALINISVDEPSRDDVYDGGGIPLLVNLLQLPNENIQANALWALINLTNNDANKESVCEVPQAIIWVVGLSGGNPHLQAYALKLLANLSESATNHGCMLDSSVTVPLLKVLVTSRNMSLMSYALFYFRNLAKTVEGREAVLAAAGLKVFVHLLKTYSSPQVRGPVLLILNTLAHHHQEATLQMLKLGALQPLMQTVQAGQDAVILLALNLLKTFAADARTHKVLVRVLADGGPSLKSLLALQQPKAPTLLAQLLQTLIPPDWSSTDDQSARAVLDTVLECLAEARVRPDVQESILLIFLPMAKLGNEYVLQDHALAAFVGKASSSSDVAVQQRALHLLALLALNPGGRLRMAKIGGLNKLLTILANPDDDPTVLTLALLALQNLLLDAQLRDIVIKTQRLRLGPFLQATEPSVAGAAQRLLQSIKVSLEASVRSKEPLPKAAAAAKPRASPTANRGGSTIIRRPAQPPTHSKQPRTAPTTAAGSGPEEDGGEVVPKREPGDDKSAKASSSEQQDEQEEEEEEEGRSSSSSTPLELFRRRSSQLSLSTPRV